MLITLDLTSTTLDLETNTATVSATLDLDAIERLLTRTHRSEDLAIAFGEGAPALPLLQPEDEKALAPCYDMMQVISHHLQSRAKHLSTELE